MRKLFIVLTLLLAYVVGMAQTFEVNGLYYEIVSSLDKTVGVTINPNKYQSASYEIPEKVAYNGVEYSVTSIEGPAFRSCSNLISIIIPNSVISIGNAAFAYCKDLSSVNIPKSVTNIGEYAFYGCSNLTSITIPNSVTSIGSFAFGECSGLMSVTIPNSVTSIGNNAFAYCSGLTSAIIPNSITSIGEGAFVECKGLKDVYNKASTPQSNSGLIPTSCRIHVKEGLEGIYKATSAWGNYTIVDDITRLNLTKITLDKEQIYCKVYDKAKLAFVFEPADADNPTVNFSSSDPSIVMVVGTDGQLLALKEGKAIIIATAADGSGVTAICEVIVGPEPYSMNVSTSANGSIIYGSAIIANESKSFQITEDDEITLTIIPKNDYRLASLIVNGKNVTADVKGNTYTISNFTSDVSVSAVFEEIPYELEDVNRDGLINAADVVQIYNKIIEG